MTSTVDLQGLGLALGGGGARGAYEIGAWRAFLQLGLQFTAIAGTSIGAINAAILLSSGYESALELWNNLQVEQCIELSPQTSLRADQDVLNIRNAKALAHEIVHQGGLSTQPLRALLESLVDEDKIRTQPIRFGLMTVALSDVRSQPVWIEDIPQGQLIDYLLASAHLPGLQPVQIDGRRFLDGGFVDNLPVGMLRILGLRKIVAVDLEPKGSLHNGLPDNIQLTYIHSKKPLGGLLDVTRELLRRNQQLGYLDTLKAFGQLFGEYYAFEAIEYEKLAARFGFGMIAGLEQAALAYNLDRTLIWLADEFIEQLRSSREAAQQEYEEKRRTLEVESKVAAILSGKIKAFKMLPHLRLALLIEMTTAALQSEKPPVIPLRLFPGLSAAAQALQLIPNTEKPLKKPS